MSKAQPTVIHTDVLIIGSGAAGMTVALNLPQDKSVAILSKTALISGSTPWAQGGIAAVISDGDKIESHIEDTLNAGANLCHHDAVEFTVKHGKESVDWLINLGIKFTENKSDELHLTREGGHSMRRVIHADDATGAAVSQGMQKELLARSNISIFEDRLAIDLITSGKRAVNDNACHGTYVLNTLTDEVETILAKVVVLATGGASKAYLYTSNPDSSSGDGIAMAWRAGCSVANMEFNQFHPTCLYHPHARSFLISEAVRGEGGKLLLPDGKSFMSDFDARAELAPRDIVARAIDHEMKRFGFDHVLLDISHKPETFIKQHFPTIHEACLKFGYDMTKEPIPVVPAAHYTCGGVRVDQNGMTDLTNLYAVGEVSFTGLHGANRMASNSLLECIVYGRSAAQHIASQIEHIQYLGHSPHWDNSQVEDSDEDVVISHNWDELRRFMWDYVGIVRTDKRLLRAKHRIDLLLSEIEEFYGNYHITKDLIELRNLALVSDLIIQSALQRKESRGLHYTLDYPNSSDLPEDTILVPSQPKKRKRLSIV